MQTVTCMCACRITGACRPRRQSPRHRRSVATAAPEAQSLFDQGLLSAANFNQEEARLAFAAALTYDAGCAMCFWGVAHALGEPRQAGGAWAFERCACLHSGDTHLTGVW